MLHLIYQMFCQVVWILLLRSCHNLDFADTVGRFMRVLTATAFDCDGYSWLKDSKIKAHLHALGCSYLQQLRESHKVQYPTYHMQTQKGHAHTSLQNPKIACLACLSLKRRTVSIWKHWKPAGALGFHGLKGIATEWRHVIRFFIQDFFPKQSGHTEKFLR